jgi:hypothetical protein
VVTSTAEVPRVFARVLVALLDDADQSALEDATQIGLAVFGTVAGRAVLLPACRISGHYSYIGTAPRPQHISLEGARAIAINVASSATEPPPAGPLEVDLYRVGRFATTRPNAQRATLIGTCAGATHFARSLSIGGVQTARGGGAGSECAAARAGDAAPPLACHRFLRAELVAIDAQAVAGPPTSDDLCPQGWALSGGVCVPRDGNRPHQCADDPMECRIQCNLGSAGSCARLGGMLARGENGFRRDDRQALTFYERACERGDRAACSDLGVLYATAGAPVRDPQRALTLWRTACDDGLAQACTRLGLAEGRPAGGGAAPSLRRACAGGDPVGCLHAAMASRDTTADGGGNDVGVLLDLACDGEVARGCLELAAWMKKRGAPIGATADVTDKACRLGAVEACRGDTGVPAL